MIRRPRLLDMYILVDGKPVLCPELVSMAEWRGTHQDECIVAKAHIGNAEVSTVFLGLDHNLNVDDPEPILWETMVFGGPHNLARWRYKTRAEAEAGQERVCELIRTAPHGTPEGGGAAD